jgi:hypothetical protein
MHRHEDWILVDNGDISCMQDQGAPVATARVARRLPIDRWFYIGMAICANIVSVLGFAPSLVNTAARHVPH